MGARTLGYRSWQGHTCRNSAEVRFTSIDSFATLLSEHGRCLLGVIARSHSRSLTEFAKMTARRPSLLSRKLKTMSQYGLMELRRGERGPLRPRMLYDEMRLETSSTGATTEGTDAGP